MGTFVQNSNFNIVSCCTFEKFIKKNKLVLNNSYHIDPLYYIHIYIWFLTHAFVVTTSITYFSLHSISIFRIRVNVWNFPSLVFQHHLRLKICVKYIHSSWFHIHILPRFLLFFSILKFLVGDIVDVSTPWNITTPCILKHGSNMF